MELDDRPVPVSVAAGPTGSAGVAVPGAAPVSAASTGPLHVHASTPLRALEVVRALVEDLTATDLEELDGPAATELFGELHALSDRLSALAVRVLPTIEADGRWALDGARSFPQWLAVRAGMSVAAARRDIHLGRTLRDDLPATAAAVTAGTLPLEHARVLATVAATSPDRRAALADPTSACNESFLLTQASMLPADQLRRLTRRWAAAADPEADERGFSAAADREYLDVSQTIGGYHLAGFLTEEHGTGLALALASVAGVPPAGDERTSGQRRAQALSDLARLVLDHGLTGTGAAVRPHLSVHVDLERLTALHPMVGAPGVDGVPGPAGRGSGAGGRGPGVGDREPGVGCREPGPVRSGGVATFEDGGPVPDALLARLACDSEVTRIVFGPGSVVLDVGRSQRTVTGQLRRGVIARDRHCRYPGCDVPPAMSEVHHPHHWSDGGSTSVSNSVLLCWHHHDWVHRQGVTIVRNGAQWEFRDRRGALIG